MLYPIPENRHDIPEDQHWNSTIVIKEESFKIGMLSAEILQNLSKLTGLNRIGTFLSCCRTGVQWIRQHNSLIKGEYSPSIHQVIDSPTSLANFSKTFREISQIISVPIGLALQNQVNSNDLTQLLSQAHQTYRQKSLDLVILENRLKTLETSSKQDLTLATPQEKQKIIALKVNSLIENLGLAAARSGISELFTILTLVSALTSAYILFLEKTNTSPEELLKILKIEAELTLKIHEKKFQSSILNSDFFENIPEEDRMEILDEIHHSFVTHLDLILISNNDWIHTEFIAYKQSFNHLCDIYGIERNEINLEIDNLINKSEVLIKHKNEIEKESIKLIDEYINLATHQTEKANKFFMKFKEKLKEDIFNDYIQPEFNRTFIYLNELLTKTNNDLNEFHVSPKYGCTPFSLLSISEQHSLYSNLKTKYGPEKQQELVNMIKTICREI